MNKTNKQYKNENLHNFIKRPFLMTTSMLINCTSPNKKFIDD